MEGPYQGKCKAIGVSNFRISHQEAGLGPATRPSVHQTELHPYLQQKG